MWTYLLQASKKMAGSFLELGIAFYEAWVVPANLVACHNLVWSLGLVVVA